MELEKKTTILFPLPLHKRLAQIAKDRGVSIGYLVRTACEERYCQATTHDPLDAVRQLASLDLPVGDPQGMKQESMTRLKGVP